MLESQTESAAADPSRVHIMRDRAKRPDDGFEAMVLGWLALE
jgi:hypothetical protein